MDVLDQLPVVPAFVLAVVGAAGVSVGFVGWLGAVRENMCLLKMVNTGVR